MAVNRCLVLASVIEIRPGHVTYPACSCCYSKLQSNEELCKFHCTRCQKQFEPSDVQQRYRLQLTATDQGACQEITVFGSCLDVIFGVDATTLLRFLKHAEEHHGISDTEDILQESMKEALLGYPFYFGLKSLGHISAASKRPMASSDIYSSLAKLSCSEENLVAVQMVSPLQKWSFPTVMQKLMQNIGSLHGFCGKNKRTVNRFDSVCQITCPFQSLEEERRRQSDVDTNVNTCMNDPVADQSVDASSEISCTGSWYHSSGETCSTMGGYSVSMNIPSLRLSCDDNSLLRSHASKRSGELLDVCKSPQITSSGQLLNMIKSPQTGCKVETFCRRLSRESEESSSAPVKETKVTTEVPSLNKKVSPEKLNPCCTHEKLCITSFAEACQIHSIIDSSVEENDDVEIKDVLQNNKHINYSSLSPQSDNGHRTCESYMNHWLQDTGYDEWSDLEYLSAVHLLENDNPCGASPQNRNRTSVFPEELPFSEDINQFIQDVEELHDLCEESNPTCLKDEEYLKTTETRQSSEINSEDSKNIPSLSLSQTQVEIKSENRSSPSYMDNEGQRCLNDRNLRPFECSGMKDHHQTTLYGQTPCGVARNCQRDINESCRDFSGGVDISKPHFHWVNKGLGRKRIQNCCSHIISEGDLCSEYEDHSRTREKILKVNKSLPRTPSAEDSADFADTETHAVPRTPDFTGCSQSPVLFSQSPAWSVAFSQDGNGPQKLGQSNRDVLRLSNSDNHLGETKKASASRMFRSSGRRQQEDENAPQSLPSSPQIIPYLQLSPNVTVKSMPKSEGTPALFSQSGEQDMSVQRSFIPSGRPMRSSCQRKKALPLRELFLQRARLWKMSSTPRTSDHIGRRLGDQAGCESPDLLGTPDLFSADESVESDRISAKMSGKRKMSSGSETDSVEIFECTPDLF